LRRFFTITAASVRIAGGTVTGITGIESADAAGIDATEAGISGVRRGAWCSGDAEMIGAWLGSIVSLLDPDIIVVGGGMSQIGDPLFDRLRRIVPQRTINRFACETPIVPAQLGTTSGVLGAAAGVL
jgi:hypothetical protein